MDKLIHEIDHASDEYYLAIVTILGVNDGVCDHCANISVSAFESYGVDLESIQQDRTSQSPKV